RSAGGGGGQWCRRSRACPRRGLVRTRSGGRRRLLRRRGGARMMPTIFFGHGNPMNAIEQNAYTAAWRRIGESIPRPKGIVAISAHWYLPATLVTAVEKPRTIHDFGGFPRALYQMTYPAPGDPALARRLASLTGSELDDRWGFDHGTWSVFCHVLPSADVPIVQLSIDETQPASF